MLVMGLDPGPTESAIAVYGESGINSFEKVDNESLLEALKVTTHIDVLCIEKVASFGMPVGAEVFETVFWSGRFAQAFPGRCERLTRIDVKMHLCHQARAKDANIRQALIDKFGGIRETKKGGCLHGISGDCWSALAVAVSWYELEKVALSEAK
jgi:hypothetical protein